MLTTRQAYPWPGNIRELINVIERAVILAQGERLRFDLPEAVKPVIPSERVNAEQINIMSDTGRRQRGRENIINALRVNGGKVFGPKGTAQLLDVKPTTLASRIKRFNIDKSEYDQY